MKKDFTIEELEQKLNEINKEQKDIESLLKQKKQDEEDRRAAELALEQESRKQEIIDVRKKYHTLFDAYIKDYGYISFEDDNGDIDNDWLQRIWKWWM